MIQLMTPYAANPLLRLVLFRWPARSLRVDVSRLRVPASKATPQRVGAIVQKTATGCVVEDPNAPALLIPSIETGYSMRVLLVEDNVKLASVTHDAMRSHGFTVDHVSNANDAEEAAETVDYDSIILDLGLPDRDGLTLIEPLRKTAPSTPLLILTARDSPSSIIDALDSGADDYLCKPFVMGVLISRLRAIMRRGQPRHGTILQHGDVTFDLGQYSASVGETPLALSRREFAALHLFLRRPNHVLSRAEVEEAIYGFGDELSSNAIEVLLHRLRKKLHGAGSALYIHNMRGIGYMLMERRP